MEPASSSTRIISAGPVNTAKLVHWSRSHEPHENGPSGKSGCAPSTQKDFPQRHCTLTRFACVMERPLPKRLSRDPVPVVVSSAMSPYTEYKAKDASLRIERAFNFQWKVEDEREGEEDLASLWDKLTPEERRDLLNWLAARETEHVEV